MADTIERSASRRDVASEILAGEIDVGEIGRALKRRRRVYLLPTLIAFVLIALYVNVATKRYTAQNQILLENQETFFTRPDRVNVPAEAASQLDETAVASQVQLINSPDIARRAIKQLQLAGNDEFDPLAHTNPVSRVLMMLGIIPDPTRESADARIVDTFLQKLVVFSPPKTRVITIEFTSRDPVLAARSANTVAELYIQEQSAAKRTQAKGAAEALSAQIVDLRGKLSKADAEREHYRASSGLLAGTNNMTIGGQQLADINSDLSKARSTQADAQAKASMIRELLRSGKAADVAEVTNNDIVRRLWDQRATAQAQLALESRTLLPGHPRIKELTAAVAQYDSGLKSAARQAASTLENEAAIAGQRVANLETVLAQQKKAVGVSNADEVHLRALERIAQSFKDQLESSTTKYEEAVARQSSAATPADARIISRATAPELPSYPKKIPFIVFGTLATLIFAAGFVVASELLSGRASSGVVADEGRGATLHDRLPAAVETPDVAPVAPIAAVAPVASTREAPRAGWLRRRAARDPKPIAGVDDLVFAPVPEAPREESAKVVPKPKSKSRLALLGALTLAGVRHFGRSAAQAKDGEAELPVSVAAASTGVGWNLSPPAVEAPGETAQPVETPDDNVAEIAARIVGSHVPGRGLHVVGTGAGHDAEASDRVIALGRMLSDKGRSLIVDLGTVPVKLAALCDRENGRPKVDTLPGLSELLASTASFAEVIHRDCASRLHFIPTGGIEADFRDFDLILDALSETYDFILLLTPAFPQSEIAKVMAPYADFVVLTTVPAPDRDMLRKLEAEMIEAGAKEVLVAETTAPAMPAQQVA